MPVTGSRSVWYRPLILLLLLHSSAAGGETDPDSGLVVADGWEVVKANCLACHSAALVTQQRLSRAGWEASIRYMQANHNLWPLGESEPGILDYLASHYGPSPGAAPRRGNLPYFEPETD